jgi:hypothetical protein
VILAALASGSPERATNKRMSAADSVLFIILLSSVVMSCLLGCLWTTPDRAISDCWGEMIGRIRQRGLVSRRRRNI